MKTLQLKKCKSESGWELCDRKVRLLWGKTKAILLKCLYSIGTKQTPVSVRIHHVAKGRFTEERTYPRSADPKRSKG